MVYEFQCGLMPFVILLHAFPHRAQWKSGCLYIELLACDASHLRRVRLPAKSFHYGHFPLQYRVSWTLLPVCPLCSAPLSVWLCSVISLHCWCSCEMLTKEMIAHPGGRWRHAGTPDPGLHRHGARSSGCSVNPEDRGCILPAATLNIYYDNCIYICIFLPMLAVKWALLNMEDMFCSTQME